MVKLLIVISSRYFVNEQGVWTTSSYDYEMWSECLTSWDEITIAAPCIEQEPPKQAKRADGPSVRFVPLKDSKGVTGALLSIPGQFLLLRRPVQEHDALLLHAPSDLGTLASFWARIFKKPYGLDVRGDQTINIDYLRARGIHGASFMVSAFLGAFHWVRAGAASAIYVSQELKDRFPLPENRPMSVFSDIRLSEKWFKEPRIYPSHAGPWRICSVGRLEAQKGYTYLLEACARLAEQIGQNFTLELIGTGPEEERLRHQAKSLGISDIVSFRGFVPWGPALQRYLLEADLFVLSSLTEGMPRVVLEAMACGLPVVSTSVGGVPEVLAAQDLVPPSDVSALTGKLVEVTSQPTILSEMSHRNCERIKEFHPNKLRTGKQEFYRYLQEITTPHQHENRSKDQVVSKSFS